MSPSPPDRSPVRVAAVDCCRTLLCLLVGTLAIAVLSLWHRLVGADTPARTSSDEAEPAVIEYELDWYQYLQAFDAHHGPGGDRERAITSGSFLRGLCLWIRTRFLRGYTLGNTVYVCPNAPDVLRVHQAGHTPAFGSEFSTLVRPRRENGGLDDAPLRTFDVMLPGDFPETFLRLRDPRGLTDAYQQWLQDGRLDRVTR